MSIVINDRGPLVAGPGAPSTDPEDATGWEFSRPREVAPAELLRFQDHLAEILTAFGLDLDTTGTRDTPKRFLQALFDATAGYEGDPKLMTAFPTECHGGADCRISQIIEGPITFYALCEHHALPFSGTAYVSYVAHEQIIGISKLTRLVRMFARRFTVQERLGRQVAETLDDLLQPHGVAVRLEAEHMCTQMRGVREEQSRTVTTHWRGSFDTDPDLRAEFLGEVRGRLGSR